MTEKKTRVMLHTLGCDKNLVDAEMMLGQLSEEGFEITNDPDEADVVVVNTCCFINDAKEESIQVLLDYGEMKKAGTIQYLIAAGCLAQRYQKEIHEDIPEVDAVVGTASFDSIARVVKQVLAGKNEDAAGDLKHLVYGKKRILSTGGHYAHLKIAEGCNKNCRYCIIPKIRGPYRSVPMEALLQEAKELTAGGVRELILVAQETTLYGVDLYGKKMLPELLRQLARIPELPWIRVQYCYPEEITEELIRTIAEEPKICHYLDLPVQHCNDEVLKAMGRRTDGKSLREMIARLRKEIPDICLRTTLITGFPGESREAFEELCDFVKEARFDRLGAFAYSPEEGTPAAKMPGQIDDAIKEERREKIMELQQKVAFEKAASQVGRVLDCMVEGRIPEEGVLVCRSYMDAPEVDGYVFVETDADIMSGRMLPIRITGSEEYDLIGRIEVDDEFTE